MCGKLSSTSRLTAICLISSMPLVFGRCCERRVIGMERQRNESLEAMSLVLQSPQFQQMIDPVLIVFDVTIEHRRIRLQTDLMSQFRAYPATHRHRSCGRK